MCVCVLSCVCCHLTCVTVSATGCRRKLFSLFFCFMQLHLRLLFLQVACFLVHTGCFFFWPVDFCTILASHHKHSCLLKPLCALQVVRAGVIVYVVPDVPLQKDWACCEDLVITFCVMAHSATKRTACLTPIQKHLFRERCTCSLLLG